MASQRPGGIYPYQVTGHNVVCVIKKVPEGMFVRMDMPGVEEEEATVFVKKRTLYFKGEAFEEAKMEHNNNVESNPRVYLGSIDLHSDVHEIGEVKAEMKCGVLRVLVRTLRSSTNTYDQDLGVRMDFTDNSSGGLHTKNHPFQCNGPKLSFEKFVEFETMDEKMYVRVDMPGVDTETMQFGTDNEKRVVFYGGEAPKKMEYGEPERNYLGSFSLECDCCKIKEVEGKVLNGVLRMVVTKVKN